MAVRPEDFDFISNFDTAWAVVLGAILATLGGVVATHMERVSSRRERERNAALLFGEVLATLALILKVAGETRGRGDPYGPVTMRVLRSARREIDIYERNRERLFDLRDGALRTRIHTMMVRLVMPLEGIFDAHRELRELKERFAGSAVPPAEFAAEHARLEARRQDGFDFVVETAAQLGPIVTQLEPLARHSFQGLSEIAGTG